MAPTKPPAKTSGLLRTPGDRTGGRTASSGSGGSRSSSMFGFFSEGEERMSAGLRAWLLRSRLFPEDFINDKKDRRTARNKFCIHSFLSLVYCSYKSRLFNTIQTSHSIPGTSADLQHSA